MNLMDLFIKIGVDDQATSKIKKIGEGLKTAAKVGGAAVGAAAAGVAALTKASIGSYAEYEQLVGGVETLFGAGGKSISEYAESVKKTVPEIQKEYFTLIRSQSTVLKNASNAYKEAGMSANEYMSTVTSFSASLIQSLDGDTRAAADKAHQAIVDMSDNANKMGTDISMIQNAYQGFAKQNYTMLDNLKLGYGGTKTEMERLLQDADKLSESFNLAKDINGDLVYSYADVVDAIHVVQNNMGITGTTAEEAASTIQGAVGMMKSAWTNLITGMSDENANLDTLITQFVDSVGVAAQNIIPKISTALNAASKLVSDLIPVIVNEIPKIINENLPVIAKAAVGIVESLVDGISKNQKMLVGTVLDVVKLLTDSFIKLLPQIIELGLEVIVSLANGIAENLPELIPTIIDMILQIVDTLTDPNNLSALIDASIAIIIALADGLIDSRSKLLEKAPEIVANLVEAIIENVPKLIEAAIAIIEKLAEDIKTNLPKMVESGIEIVSSIIEGLVELGGELIMKGAEIVDSIKSGFWEKIDEAKEWGKDLIQKFIDGITAKWDSLKEKVANVAQTVKDFLGFSEPKKGPLSNFHTYAPDMMDLFISGIEGRKKKLMNAISDTFDFGEQTISAGINYKSFNGNNPHNKSVSVIQNIYSQAKTAADLMQEAIYQQERAVLLGV